MKKLHNYLRLSENRHKFYKLYYHGNKSLSEATAQSCELFGVTGTPLVTLDTEGPVFTRSHGANAERRAV